MKHCSAVEALQALKDGKKVRLQSWPPDFFGQPAKCIQIVDRQIIMSDWKTDRTVPATQVLRDLLLSDNWEIID
jgi:hypothetical protein